MQILHVVPSYLPATRYGGPIYSVHGLCRALVQEGHTVDVFTTNVDGEKNSNVPIRERVNINDVNVWYFPCPILRRLYYSPDMQHELRNRIKEYDLVHLHSVFLWPTYIAARTASRENIPYLVSPRGMLVKDLFRRKNWFIKTAWLTLIERKTILESSGLHVTSEIEEAEVKKFNIKLPVIFNVPNGIEVPEIDTLGNNSAVSEYMQPYALFVGRINWKKGLDLLIKSWTSVQDIHLLIAGNDEENYQVQLETLADKLKLNDRVHFIGPVDNNAKWKLYTDAEIFILPSLSENFGNVVLEAMCMGCPVIVSPNVGLAPVILKSNSGLVIENEPSYLAHSINKLLDIPVIRKKMGNNGREEVLNNFTWDRIAKRMEIVYKEIIKAGT